MSAYVVSREHIEYLVEAGLRLGDAPMRLSWLAPGVAPPRERYRTLRPDNASEVGQMLWKENHRSVSFRYSEVDATPPYEHVVRYAPKPLDAVQVLKAIACLAYQSNECPDWEQTEAYAFLDSLKDAAIHALPGWDDAVWGCPADRVERPRLRLTA